MASQLSAEMYFILTQNIAAVATSVQLAHFVLAVSHKSAKSSYHPSDWFLESSSAQDILEAVRIRQERLRELHEAIQANANAAEWPTCEEFVRSHCFDCRQLMTNEPSEPGRPQGIVAQSGDNFVCDASNAVIELLGVRNYNACQLVKRAVDLELYDLQLASSQERQELTTRMDDWNAVKSEVSVW